MLEHGSYSTTVNPRLTTYSRFVPSTVFVQQNCLNSWVKNMRSEVKPDHGQVRRAAQVSKKKNRSLATRSAVDRSGLRFGNADSGLHL
jgi:hypothetical protein